MVVAPIAVFLVLTRWQRRREATTGAPPTG